MSIKVEQVTKRYGAQKALNEVSFSIGSGEIVGFLGPNGAGKSTMMKILTCFIPPSAGEASVCGLSVHKNSVAVRRKVGYLPEHNPLHPEMYVQEYLHFIAGIHGLKNKRKRVDELLGMVGLRREQHKQIGALSKGYRQRVGLAQAMIHDPEVLILDEPTSGLDPNQLADIRSLIHEIGKKKTVMLSTHIMQEVEAICDRVIIIDKGVIVADDEAGKLKTSNQKKANIVVEFDGEMASAKLQGIKGVKHVERKGNNTWLVQSPADQDVRPLIFELAVAQGLKVLSMAREESGMEDVFKSLTGKS